MRSRISDFSLSFVAAAVTRRPYSNVLTGLAIDDWLLAIFPFHPLFALLPFIFKLQEASETLSKLHYQRVMGKENPCRNRPAPSAPRATAQPYPSCRIGPRLERSVIRAPALHVSNVVTGLAIGDRLLAIFHFPSSILHHAVASERRRAATVQPPMEHKPGFTSTKNLTK
jgi:hypothetical protein